MVSGRIAVSLCFLTHIAEASQTPDPLASCDGPDGTCASQATSSMMQRAADRHLDVKEGQADTRAYTHTASEAPSSYKEETTFKTTPEIPSAADVDAAKKTLVRDLCRDWNLMMDCGVIKDGDSVCCTSLPADCETRHCSNASTCKLPGQRDKEMYFRNVEPICNSAVHQQTSQITNFVFQGLPEAELNNFLHSLDRQKLMECELLYETNIVSTGAECQKDEPILQYVSKTSLSQVNQQHSELVSHITWRVKPVEHPVARQFGHVHSFLDVYAGGKHYQFDVYPADVGVRAGGHLVPSGEIDGKVYAEAGLESLRPHVSVSDVLATLRQYEDTQYDIVSNNCHTLIEKTFKWVAPGAIAPKSPNSNWELVAKSIDRASPSSVNLLLEIAGASRRMCP